MRIFSLDYSEKLLHVAIETKLSQWEHEENRSIHGIVYRPDAVFNKLNDLSESLYGELFKPGQFYETAVVETQMGPGELAKVLAKKFSVDAGMHIGGIIATFRTTKTQANRIIRDLAAHSETYLISEEKKLYG